MYVLCVLNKYILMRWKGAAESRLANCPLYIFFPDLAPPALPAHTLSRHPRQSSRLSFMVLCTVCVALTQRAVCSPPLQQAQGGRGAGTKGGTYLVRSS